MSWTLHQIRILRAPPERVYRALLDPAAICKWNPPDGFTGVVHDADVRVGGRFRMSFTHLATGRSHTFGGEYRELVPNERIVAVDRFEEGLEGEIGITYGLRAVPSGTELAIEQKGLPDAIPEDACRLGWQQSLDLLARLVEDPPGADAEPAPPSP